MKSISTILLFSFLSALLSCKDKDVPTPKQEGTLSYRINDSLWVSKRTEATYIAGQILYVRGDGTNFNGNMEQSFWILMDGSQDANNHYALGERNTLQISKDGFTYDSSWCQQYSQYVSIGEVIITEVDTVHQTISGRFNGVLYFPECQHPLSIADGEFYKVKLLE